MPERGWRWCRRNPALASATALAVAALVAVTAISITFAVSQFRSRAKLTTAYGDLSHAEQRTGEALHNSQRLASELALNRGQSLGEQGEVNQALLWMVQSLKLAPADASELQSVDRTNLALWQGQIHPLRAILPHEAGVFTVAYMSDGKALTAAANRTVQLWDATAGKPIGRQIGEPAKQLNPIFAVAFSSDGKTALTEGAENTALLWDVATGNRIGKLVWDRRLGGSIRIAAFSPDGKRVPDRLYELSGRW